MSWSPSAALKRRARSRTHTRARRSRRRTRTTSGRDAVRSDGEEHDEGRVLRRAGRDRSRRCAARAARRTTRPPRASSATRAAAAAVPLSQAARTTLAIARTRHVATKGAMRSRPDQDARRVCRAIPLAVGQVVPEAKLTEQEQRAGDVDRPARAGRSRRPPGRPRPPRWPPGRRASGRKRSSQ